MTSAFSGTVEPHGDTKFLPLGGHEHMFWVFFKVQLRKKIFISTHLSLKAFFSKI